MESQLLKWHLFSCGSFICMCAWFYFCVALITEVSLYIIVHWTSCCTVHSFPHGDDFLFLQVFAIELVTIAVDFAPLAVEFGTFAVKFVGFSVEFIVLALQSVTLAIELDTFALGLDAFALELVVFALEFVMAIMTLKTNYLSRSEWFLPWKVPPETEKGDWS